MREVAGGSLRKAADSSVLVVGVGAWLGLGAAIARRFAGGGHPVVIAGRNAQKLEATAAELHRAGARASCVVGDAALRPAAFAPITSKGLPDTSHAGSARPADNFSRSA